MENENLTFILKRHRQWEGFGSVRGATATPRRGVPLKHIKVLIFHMYKNKVCITNHLKSDTRTPVKSFTRKHCAIKRS